MNKIIFSFVLILCSVFSAHAQFDNYIRISGDAGVVANSERDKKIGLGGSVSWLTIDRFISGTNGNFISLGVKAFNNPYGDGKFLSSIMNDIDDGFNYIMPLIGYRFAQKGIDEGFFIEPRIGLAFGAGYTAFAVSPLAGYTFDKLDIALFCDLGFGNKNNAIRNKNFFTPGVSVAYSFGL